MKANSRKDRLQSSTRENGDATKDARSGWMRGLGGENGQLETPNIMKHIASGASAGSSFFSCAEGTGEINFTLASCAPLPTYFQQAITG